MPIHRSNFYLQHLNRCQIVSHLGREDLIYEEVTLTLHKIEVRQNRAACQNNMVQDFNRAN